MKDYLKAVGAMFGALLFITFLRFAYFQSNLGATAPLLGFICLAIMFLIGDMVSDEVIDEQDRQKRISAREDK